MEANTLKNDGGEAEGRFDDILSLVLAHSRGEVQNEEVEHALSSIVPEPNNNEKPRGWKRHHNGGKKIIPDEDNYDDDDEGGSTQTAQANVVNTKPPKKSKGNTTASAKKRNYTESMDEIPLGAMGARMIITFGDGPNPSPSVVAAALLGARTCLQRAILDARALRRKLKDRWHQAKAVTSIHHGGTCNTHLKKTLHGAVNTEIDSELYFRALDGFDALRFDVPCGFDTHQLETLYPEEMQAYQRWRKMHKAYTENSNDLADDAINGKGDSEHTENNEAQENINREEMENNDESTFKNTRLFERLANFDARTVRMAGDWYMTFSDVRSGSFLPRRFGSRQDTREWRRNQKTSKRSGRHSQSSWQSLHPSSVVFLHWIGFDHRSALPPPNEETTQALGFLAYDFFGKIVEKAVALRLKCDTNNMRKPSETDRNNPILELTGGDQLEKENIDQALAENAVSSNSLYRSSGHSRRTSPETAQLYFGPGFEDRLEIELDEIFGQKEKKLSQEEIRLRKEEENLFSQISCPPELLSRVSDVLGNDTSSNDDQVKTSTPNDK